MTNLEFFAGNDEMIKDEIITFFLAGMKTIQVTTTNLIYYLTKYPEHKKRLLEEILPPVAKISDSIVEKFDYDTVMEFEYLQ